MSAKDLFYDQEREFSHNEQKLYFREDFIYSVTEDLLIALENDDISKVELAKKMSKSKAFITQLLSGSRNMTLGTLADICFTINIKPELILKKTTDHKSEKDHQKNLHWQSFNINKSLEIKQKNYTRQKKACKVIDLQSKITWLKAS